MNQRQWFSALVLGCGCWLAATGLAAAASPGFGPSLGVQVDANRVTLTAKAWEVTLADGMVIGVKNRLTGDLFADSAKGTPSTVPVGLGVQTGALAEAKKLHGPWGTIDLKQGETDPNQNFPSQHRPAAGSAVTITRPDKLTVAMTWHGLAAGSKSFADETLELTARLEPESGALVLATAGSSAGGGVYGAAVGVANLDKSLKAYVAHMGRCPIPRWTGSPTLSRPIPFSSPQNARSRVPSAAAKSEWTRKEARTSNFPRLSEPFRRRARRVPFRRSGIGTRARRQQMRGPGSRRRPGGGSGAAPPMNGTDFTCPGAAVRRRRGRG